MKIKNIKKKIKNNEENQLITKNTNIEYNNNEDNRLRIMVAISKTVITKALQLSPTGIHQ